MKQIFASLTASTHLQLAKSYLTAIFSASLFCRSLIDGIVLVNFVASRKLSVFHPNLCRLKCGAVTQTESRISLFGHRTRYPTTWRCSRRRRKKRNRACMHLRHLHRSSTYHCQQLVYRAQSMTLMTCKEKYSMRTLRTLTGMVYTSVTFCQSIFLASPHCQIAK